MEVRAPWIRFVLLVSVLSAAAEAGTMGFGSPSVTTVLQSGPSDQKVDIVFVGEGYTSAEMTKYVSDVQGAVAYLFSIEPWKSYKSSCNVFQVNVVSSQSGSDVNGVYVNTPFDTRYSGRLIYVDNFTNVSTAAAKAPAKDVVLMLVNCSTYGGSGYFSGTATAYNGYYRNQVLVHEMGHSFAQLTDEYQYNNGSRYSGSEPTHPNATIEPDPTRVKWRQYVGIEGTGVFEGAHYNDYGIYRPTSGSCTMRTLQDRFCIVCRQSGIVAKIQKLSTATSSGPVAVATATPTSGTAPLTVSLSGSASTGTIVSYQWNFGDGSTGVGVSVSHVYQAGTFVAKLTVTDDKGLSHTSSVTVSATTSSSTSIAAPSSLTGSVSGSTVRLSWRDNSTNEEGFMIERAPKGQTSFSAIGQVGANATTFSYSAPRGWYDYRVRAFNRSTGQVSGYSNVVRLAVNGK